MILTLLGLLTVAAIEFSVHSAAWGAQYQGEVGVVGPSLHTHYSATGGPVDAGADPWVTVPLYSAHGRPRSIRVLGVHLIPVEGVASPRVVRWKLSDEMGASNQSGVGWPPTFGANALGRVARPAPRDGFLAAIRFKTVRPYYGSDVYVELAPPPGARDYALFAFAVTYEESDYSVYTQTIPQGYVFCGVPTVTYETTAQKAACGTFINSVWAIPGL
ncbi:MAG: hypothetical protein ACRDV0_00530 [Acidimicrobiales bacterium]